MVYGFCKQSGGHVNLHSDAGRGTTLKLYLPQAKEIASPCPSRAPCDRGTEAVLLVEDDAEVRAATSKMLSGLGYQVVEAADAASALTLLETKRRASSVVHRCGSGARHEWAGARRQGKTNSAGSKVLFMSGYVRDTVAFHEQLERDAHFLGKAFQQGRACAEGTARPR